MADEDGTPILISGSRDKSIIRWQLHLTEPKEVVIKLHEDDEEVEDGQPKEIRNIQLEKLSNFLMVIIILYLH